MAAGATLSLLAEMAKSGEVRIRVMPLGETRVIWERGDRTGDPGNGRDLSSAVGAAWLNSTHPQAARRMAEIRASG